MIVEGKTAQGLVQHAQRALSQKWWYVWGTLGEPLTKKKLDWCVRTYPTRNSYEMHNPHLGEMVSDCVGLVKSYCMWDDAKDKVVYVGSMDKNTGGMYNIAKVKGPITTIPEIPGVIVYKKGHVGIYAGQGQVIECAYGKGVIKTPLKGGTPWTHWFQCPYIAYDSDSAAAKPFPTKVHVREGAKDYSGKGLARWVYRAELDVLSYNGDRVVIGLGTAVTAAVHKKDLY